MQSVGAADLTTKKDGSVSRFSYHFLSFRFTFDAVFRKIVKLCTGGYELFFSSDECEKGHCSKKSFGLISIGIATDGDFLLYAIWL